MPRISFDKEFWVISCLIVLAIALRLPTLGSPLIEDEAIAFNRYVDVPWTKLMLSSMYVGQHTLFLLHTVMSVSDSAFVSVRCSIYSYNLPTWIGN